MNKTEIFKRSNSTYLCNNQRYPCFCKTVVNKLGIRRFEDGFRSELSESQNKQYESSDYCESCSGLLRDVLNNSEIMDKLAVLSLLNCYKQESRMQYSEDNEDLGVDQKLLDSIEELVKYIGTKEEIAKFNLQFKNK